MAKKEKKAKEPKKKKPKKPKKNKGPTVIEDVFAGILTFLLVLVGIGNLVLAAFIGYSYLKSKFNLDPTPQPTVTETAYTHEGTLLEDIFLL